MSLTKKSMAGPPPFTITCEPKPNENPTYFSGEGSSASAGPPDMGWVPPSQYPPQYPGNAQPIPYPPLHQPVAVHGMQPGVHAANSASVVYVAHHQQPQVVIQGLMPKHSTMVTCPSCRNQSATNVVHKANTRTHLWAFCLCIWGFWLCCLCAAPYCMNSCKNSEHYCSNCGAYIGVAL